MINKTHGNMYNFSDTWNPIKGECLHGCVYCYMKKWGKQKPVYLDKKYFNKPIKSDKTIFVCSGTDMFGDWIPAEWIIKVLDYCKQFDNTYLFQSKNPGRFLNFKDLFPEKTILCTTIESDKYYKHIYQNDNISFPQKRMQDLIYMKICYDFKIMITIEPILDFYLSFFPYWIIENNNEFGGFEQINIGADSKGHNLPEPSKEKLKRFIAALDKAGCNLYLKSNLQRLLK